MSSLCRAATLSILLWFHSINVVSFTKQAVGGRAAATICPRPSPTLVGAEAPCPTEQTATYQQFATANTFPRHRCSHLTHQHGGERNGLVTLTFDLLTLKVVSESRVTWATSVPILVFLGLSVLDLGPMYATDRQTSDRIIALCPRLLGEGA